MNEPLESKKFKRILKDLQDYKDPHLMEVSSVRLNTKTGFQEDQPTYTCCSACYSIIEQTWDHAEWCELYEQEAVAKWLEKGKNEK